jgi:hypothetical protein
MNTTEAKSINYAAPNQQKRGYIFYIEGLDREVSQIADSQKAAHSAIWKSLSDEEKNRVVCLDCIDCIDVDPA